MFILMHLHDWFRLEIPPICSGWMILQKELIMTVLPLCMQRARIARHGVPRFRLFPRLLTVPLILLTMFMWTVAIFTLQSVKRTSSSALERLRWMIWLLPQISTMSNLIPQIISQRKLSVLPTMSMQTPCLPLL